MWLRASIGAVLGIAAWLLWAAVIPSVPTLPRFVVTFAVFVVGPGAAAATWLARGTGSLMERTVVALAAGLFLSAALAQLLGAFDLERLCPIAAAGLGGGAVASGFLTRTGRRPGIGRGDAIACALAGSLALGAGLVAYAHRLELRPDGVTFYGSYDTFDSSYYAAISAELSHQIPPQSIFRAGHGLGYAYHPHLLLAMVHRFGDVPLFDIYFGYAWPAFLVVMAMTTFVVVRRLTSTGVAFLAVCLVLFGSDVSYVPAKLRPPYADWDRMMWSSNWLTPGAEILYFNTWTPALAVLLLGFWMIDRHQDAPRARWLLGAGACFAALLEFKPFGFAPAIAGLAAASLFAGGNRESRRRFAIVMMASLVLALPYLYLIRSTYEESQAVLRPGIGYATVLPEKIVTQVGLQLPVARLADLLGGSAAATTVVSVVLANLLFFVGGFGARLVGVPGVWRALKGGETRDVWRVIAWTVAAGVAFPLAVVTEPYHQTFHTVHTSLFLLWIFVARQVFDWTPASRWGRVVLVTLVLATAIPPTVHFLRLKWTDFRFGFINRDSFTIAQELRQLDFDRTVFLQRYPRGPSFVAILAERRTVLAWSQYARESAPLADEIDAFFRSAKGDPAAAWQLLRRQGVTHVVETLELDQIHPEVLCRLRLLRATETLNLYEIPATDPGRCPGGQAPSGSSR